MSAADPVAAHEAPEDDNTFKVFAGNLSFSVTEDALRTEFNKAGDVYVSHTSPLGVASRSSLPCSSCRLSANIIVRSGRSLGYGFISYATEGEAKKAVELFDKVELSGRPLNVEVAKPKAAADAAPRAPRRTRSKKGKTEGAAPAADGAEVAAPKRTRGGKQEARIDQDTAPDAGAEGDAPKRTRKPRSRKKVLKAGAAGAAVNDENEVGAAPAEGGVTPADAKTRRPRPKREKPIGNAEGPLSETMLFVANLPFKVDNAALGHIFNGYKVTSSKVVTLRNGRSKGFGFVEVADKSEQDRVLNELQNVQVDGRDLIIKVALQSSHNQPEGEEVAQE
ncbi:hypothetical protein HK101_003842 [Irineochytrium annulatum]|nr:hypothetical protein HK101_003842 [Irineochytrium annulatum]